MKKCFIVLLMLVSFPCHAADYYIAQMSAGLGNALSCANAKSVTWNWRSPNVIDGDKVHICGTITSPLQVPVGGVSSPITILFEAGAKFSKDAWGIQNSSAISIESKNWITIDGNNLGIIENTNNGTALGLQKDTTGIYIQGSNNIEVKNMTIRNLYVRTPNSHDPNAFAKAVFAYDGNNMKFHDLIIKEAYYGIYTYAGAMNKDSLNIYYNDISRVSTGIVAALAGSVNYTGVNIYNNKIYDQYVWDGCWGGTGSDQCTGGTWQHNDGIHLWGNYGSGNNYLSANVYNNEIGGNFGAHATGMIFIEDYVTPFTAYNNVLYSNNAKPTNGFIALKTKLTSAIARIYNNTIIGLGAATTGGIGIYFDGYGIGGTVDIKNNIIMNCYSGLFDSTRTAIISSDYNDFYNVGNIGYSASFKRALADWQTFLGGCPGINNDCNSIVKDPLLASDYTIPYNSPAKDAGTNLSSIFTSDKRGFTRYRGSGWDIGAFEYNNPEPPRNLKFK